MPLARPLAALALLFLACAAQAQDALPSAQRAVELLRANRTAEALDALDDAAAAAWLASPLRFRRALLVEAPAAGFGIYQPRADSVFDGRSPLLIYAEPVGYGWRRNGEMVEIDLALDVAIKSPAGAVLLEKKDFQRLRLASRARNREFMINLTLTVTGAPAGRYVAVFTARDQATGKSGAFEVGFEIRT